MIRRLLSLLALVAFSGAAQAEWKEASTRNFLVYSEGSEADLRSFAEKLEKFDFVLRRFHRLDAPPSPYRLRVFLLANQAAVADMAGAPGSGIAGYYIPDARGMMLVGSRNVRQLHVGGGSLNLEENSADLDSERVLLHEYTHHFMYQYFPATYPSWYSEGWAEFWGATRFADNGVIEVGHPASHRFRSFSANRWMPMQELLSAQNYSQVGEVDLLYAQGWLLVRYAWENPERQRQLQQYLTLINRGTAYGDAARQAFGDLGRLNDELRAYSGRSRFNVLSLPFRAIDIGEIRIRTLSPTEQALFRSEIDFSQGISNEEFPEFSARVRQQAAAFPSDPFALRLLVEVERTANNLASARAALDRLLAVTPEDPRGLMYKGLVEIEALRTAGNGSGPAWQEARRPIERALAISPNDPLVQEAYYDSYSATGRLPPDEAQAALYRAMELAPSDSRIRYKVASDFEQRNLLPEAIAIIRPDANRVPERRSESERERQRRLAREDRYRRAGTARRETAREMLERLLRKQQESAPASAS